MSEDNADIAPDTTENESTWQADAGLDGDVNFEKFETVGDLAKSYGELQSNMGNAIRFPSKEAGEEDIGKFNAKMGEQGFYRAPDQNDAEGTRNIQALLGMPQEVGGYQFNDVEGYDADPESEGAFKAVAHGLGLTQDQADGIHNWLGSNIAQGNADNASTTQEAMQELKGQWGQAYDHKMQGAKNAANALNEKVPGIADYFDQMAAEGNDTNMIRLMDAFAEVMGETGAIPPSAGNNMTPTEAQSRLSEMRDNPQHPIHLGAGPAYDRAVKERLELNKAAYGG